MPASSSHCPLTTITCKVKINNKTEACIMISLSAVVLQNRERSSWLSYIYKLQQIKKLMFTKMWKTLWQRSSIVIWTQFNVNDNLASLNIIGTCWVKQYYWPQYFYLIVSVNTWTRQLYPCICVYMYMSLIVKKFK